MGGDQSFHAMDIDPPPSEDDEDHNDDQTDEEENHEDPDGLEDPENRPPDDGQEEDQEDMEVENRFGNGVINDGGPQENGFHEGSATSSPLGSVARGNSPNSVLSFPSFTVLHGDRDMLPNYNPLELTQATFSPLSNPIPSEDEPQETNGLENYVDVVSYVEPSVLVNSQISGNSNVLSVDEHNVDVPSPGIGDLNTKDKDRKFSVGTMDNLPAWWRSWGFFCNAKTNIVQADQDTLFDTENEMVVKEVDAESLPQLREMAEKEVNGLTEYHHESSSKSQGKGKHEAKTLVRRTFKRQGMSFMARQAQQKRGTQMLMYQKELRTNGTLATDQSLIVPTYQPHRTLERLKIWKRQMALENMTVRSDLLVGNEAKETDTMAKRPREVTEEE
ncbi:OLC1v1036396C1 [Oldenlandia corymbosa var. corymbosa]|uniref:OLC1v1036396C1 n=1 Tax=Oldenlandia corymbosa var. corymbosa TaxID=529605 RepID=A0AAV1CV68_OLDCO|nr:OLC1v1036396C1 [Oldenlandia corymbosa var. corymbosa]